METSSPGPANLHYHNAGIGCLREQAGLPIRTAIDAYNLMDSYVYGFALQEKTLPSDIAAAAERDGKTSPPRTHPSPAGSPTSSRSSKSSGHRATTTRASSNEVSNSSSTASNSSATKSKVTLGWASTYDAEYIALTKLQADALLALDPKLARSAEGLVAIASIDALW
jgi:hypothetical protein